MIKKTTFLLAVFIAAFYLFSSSNTYSKVNQPPTLNSSAPPHGTCTTPTCHGGAPNTGTGNVSIGFGDFDLKYLPGETYDMSVTVSDATKVRFGFEMVAFNKTKIDNEEAFDLSEGSFIASGANTGTQTDALGDRYVNHSQIPLNNDNTFNFQWTAPSEDVGDITFYVSGCAANGNNNRTGDLIYNNNLTVSFDNGVGIESLEQNESFYYPNPATDHVLVDFAALNGNQVSISLFDVQGSLKAVLFNQQIEDASNTQRLDLPTDLLPGLYLLSTQVDGESYTQKLMIQ